VASVASDVELQTVIVSDGGPAARVTLNRPDKRNALSLALMD
jgi:enoyl-CoA hydratase/carnithine racemase